jgi:hypothetical protein
LRNGSSSLAAEERLVTMRSTLAPVAAFSLLGALALAALPAAEACSLLGAPTGCATAVYDSLKTNVNVMAAHLQGWGQAAAQHVGACPSVAVGVPVPGFDSSPIGDYAAGMQQEFQAFHDGLASDAFPAASNFVGNGWFRTMAVVIQYDDGAETMVVPLVPDPQNLQPPDVSSVDAVEAQALAFGLGAQGQALGMAACIQALPQPPL